MAVLSNQYAAGFFDGEGYVGIVKGKTHPKPVYTLETSLNNTSKEILDLFAQTYVGRVCAKPGGINKPLFYWYARGQKAVSFLQQVEPLLVDKKVQAWLGLEYYAQTKLYDKSGYMEALREGFYLALRLAKNGTFAKEQENYFGKR